MTDLATAPDAPVSPLYAAPAPILRECLNCPAKFIPNPDPRATQPPAYCSPKCRDMAGNRNALQGKAVMPLLKAWRLSRNSKGRAEIGRQCLSELSSIVDRFIDQDREDGRDSAKLFAAAHHLLSLGRYIDRQRPKRDKRLAV